ncbi:hypothetical protein CN090_32745 [Sinorhizobium meliloti]|nr:hypothetical protein CN108_32005 [Sinorhizobium meliloti]RVN55824.1 hypothetical protein CN104_29455 [Sinorhizobium meliloti]RVO18211.1 hypothetical protein CN100_30300 [Sinorhizobium meliloti]RVO41700.1 hypothetical protein CN090_32745 [Sinorhizobium meliloti]
MSRTSTRTSRFPTRSWRSFRPEERKGTPLWPAGHLPRKAGESHLANKRLFCCGKSILGVLR